MGIRLFNNILKGIFLLTAIFFLYTLASTPKTNCDACEFEFDGRTIDGNKAFDLFYEACIYNLKPSDEFYVDIDDISLVNGSYSWNASDEIKKEELYS